MYIILFSIITTFLWSLNFQDTAVPLNNAITTITNSNQSQSFILTDNKVAIPYFKNQRKPA